MQKLSKNALALSIGITWGAALFILSFLAMFGFGEYFVEMLSSIYIFYNSTIIGSFMGLVWGFIDGAIFGFVVAYLYNVFIKTKKLKK